MAEYNLQCSACGYEQPETSYVVACPKCGGLMAFLPQETVWQGLER